MGIKEETDVVGVKASGTLDFSSVEARQAAVNRMFQQVTERKAREDACDFSSTAKQWTLARWIMGRFFELNHRVIFHRLLKEPKKKTFSSTTFETSALRPVEMTDGEAFLSAKQASPRDKFESVLQQALQECFSDKALVVGLTVRPEAVGEALRLYFLFKLCWGRFVTEASVDPRVPLDSNKLDLSDSAMRLRDESGWEHGSLIECVRKVFSSNTGVQMTIFEAAKAGRDSATLDLISESYDSSCSFFTQLFGLATINAAMARELAQRFPNLVFTDILLEADERYVPRRLRLQATITWD